MKTLLGILLLAAGVAAQSAVAHVDDPVSPGTVGDRALSLDEAIQLANGTLTVAQLSAAEAARVTGSGVPATIEIDATAVPTITLRAPLTPLDGPAGGGAVVVRGVGGRPVIDAGAHPVALRLRTNLCDVVGLTFRGGAVAIDADTSAHLTMGRQLLLDGLAFEGQSQTGVRLSAVGMMRMLPVMLRHATFTRLPTAIDIDDRSQGGPVMADVENVVFDGVRLGVNLFLGATGNMTMCRMWRCKMPNGERLAVVRRDPASDQRLMLMLVAGEFATAEDMVDADGTPLVETAVHVHASKLRPAPGKRAFRLGPQDARCDFHISENDITGDIEVAEGRLNRRLWAWNNVFRDATIAVSNQGTPTSYRWNRFENCTIRALPTNSAQFTHTSSEFHGCVLDGQSLTGRVFLENCVTDAATVTTGNVAIQSPAPSPWLARTDASTDTPAVGSSVDLVLDLPPGMLGVWQIGVSNPRVVLTQEPWRDYAFQSPALLLPGIYALHTTLTIPVPIDPNLVGAELYCAPITAPVQGQAHVPAFNLPRGVHLSITR